MGAEVLRGDLNDTDVLRAGALDSDGVIHLAFVVPSVSEAATRTDAAPSRRSGPASPAPASPW
jgi:hypothetical protein